MTDLPRILQNYHAEDSYLANQEARQVTVAARRLWQQRRHIHDQAYFVMIFAQFESYLNDQCERLVRRKQQLANWLQRRAWEIIDPTRLDRLSFRTRLALLTEKGHADYNVADRFYRVRCDLAHGTLVPSLPAAIPTVASDLQGIASRLRAR